MLQAFEDYKDKIIKEFGTNALYEQQIEKYCEDHFPNFGGVFTHDKLKPEDHKCYVLNTGNDASPGYHWVGAYVTPYHFYVFDSFHRNIHQIIKDINKIEHGRDLITSKSRVPIQHDDNPKEENICGQLSMAWLQCLKHYGIRNAIQI